MAEKDGVAYASQAYARSLAADADTIALSRAGGYLIARKVEPGVRDLSSAYPMLSCRHWNSLRADIDAISKDFVSVTIVTDPFAGVVQKELSAAFDVVRPLHQHFVIDLDLWASERISRHHRRKLRTYRESTDCRIEIGPPDENFLEHWLRLYQALIDRKGITDVRAFSRSIFSQQMQVPGAVIASAWGGSELLGADWYFRDGAYVYAHLSAYSEAGYQRAISYPLMQTAIEHFRPLSSCLTLGGVPTGQEQGGLAFFKAGWASRTLPNYICGLVLIEEEFRRLNGGISPTVGGYFPYYRRKEFANTVCI